MPLLVENQLQSMTDTVLVVDVSRDTQIQRTMNRDNVPQAQVESILNAQATREERLSHANDVIDNDSPESDLLSQVTALHQKFLSMSH